MLDILAITGPIYLAIGLGFGLTRAGWFARNDMRVLGQFVIRLALPALLFNALSQRRLSDILNFDYLLVYTLAGLLVIALGWAWVRWGQRRSMSWSSTVAMGMSCPNSGFVGYPVLLLLLGSSTAGVALALNMVVENLLLIPLLLLLADLDDPRAGGGWRAVRQTLVGLSRNPMIWGMVAGMVAALLEWRLPAPLARTVNLFAQASGALSLFVIGGSLVGLQVQGVRAAVAQIALGKLVLHPLAVVVVMAWWVPLSDPALRTAVVLSGAMPMLGIYAILAQRHGHEGMASAALLATTLASFFSLNLLLWGLTQVGWLG